MSFSDAKNDLQLYFDNQMYQYDKLDTTRNITFNPKILTETSFGIILNFGRVSHT